MMKGKLLFAVAIQTPICQYMAFGDIDVMLNMSANFEKHNERHPERPAKIIGCAGFNDPVAYLNKYFKLMERIVDKDMTVLCHNTIPRHVNTLIGIMSEFDLDFADLDPDIDGELLTEISKCFVTA